MPWHIYHPESFNNSPFDSESDPRNYQKNDAAIFFAQWRTSISARASPASEFVRGDFQLTSVPHLVQYWEKLIYCIPDTNRPVRTLDHTKKWMSSCHILPLISDQCLILFALNSEYVTNARKKWRAFTFFTIITLSSLRIRFIATSQYIH